VSDDLADVARHAPVDRDSAEDADGAEGGGYEVALQWTALEPGRTADAILDLNLAGDWDEFRAAASSFEVPAQNLLYADTAGNIGYQAPGRIPIRSRYMEAAPGFWIRPGWVSSWDWQGYVPFDQMPHTYNPPEGFTTETGTRTFALNELHVRADCRGSGVASSLHSKLLESGQYERATVLVRPENPALSLYWHWGYREIGKLKPYPDSPLYLAMVLQLPQQPGTAS
jgi:ribosomal protein S18 acetylase RimI-like enzyme